MQINHQPGHRDGDAHSHKMEGHPVPVEGGAGGKGMAAERGSVNERPGECLMHRRDDETSVLPPAVGRPLGSGAQSGQAPAQSYGHAASCAGLPVFITNGNKPCFSKERVP